LKVTKKLFVFSLIFLLSFVSIAVVLKPVRADTWTDITLPYTITQSGNYRITSPWTGTGTGLTIEASNVVVDGQNNLLQLTQDSGDCAIQISSGSLNVVLQNINETTGSLGLYALSGNFTVQDSNFSNNTEYGLLAFSMGNFTVKHSNLSNNTYGLIAYSSGNFTVQDSNLSNNSYGLEADLSSNFIIQNSDLNNNNYTGLMATSSGNFTVVDSNLQNNTYGLFAYSSGNFTIENSNLNNNNDVGLFSISGNFTVVDSDLNNNSFGLAAFSSDDFTVAHSIVNNNHMVGLFATSDNFTIKDSSLNNNTLFGMFAELCNFTVEYSNLNNNAVGLEANVSGYFTIECSNLNNNTYYGLWDIYGNNAMVNGSIFSGNGLYNDAAYAGGFEADDSNCTVTNNVFDSNYDGLLWGVTEDTDNNTQVYYNNMFQNNNYTFHFDYELPNNYTNQQLLFFNNLVNDSAYVDPDSFTSDCSGSYMPFNSNILNFNTSLQSGTRIYSSGSMIGGNYWAHPNGTGYSQTGTDANNDGFVDTPFDFFGNGTIYDYLPYSSSYTASLAYTVGIHQYLAANQMSSMITVQVQDSFGKVTSGVTFSLASNSSTGKFYSDQAGNNQTSSVTIPAGSSSGSFYYKDTTAGTPTLTVSAQGATSATTQFTINDHSSAVASVAITPAASTVTAGGTKTYSATASDAYGNTWDVTSSTTWSISSGAGGSWNGNIYTSANAGTWTVTGTYASTPYTTTLSVTASSPSPTPTPSPTPIPTPEPTPTPSPSPSPSPTSTIQATTESGTTVDLTISGNITSSQIFSVNITTNQSAATTTISFTLTGQSGTTGFSNITTPKSAVPYGATPSIYIDNQPAQDQGYTQDANNYYVWYTTHFSTHEVSIVFTTTSSSSLPLEAIYGVAAAVAIVVIVAVAFVLRKSKKGKS